MTRQINKEGRLSDFPSEVRHLWHTRHDEPPQQVFDRLPGWMQPSLPDVDRRIDLDRVLPRSMATLTSTDRLVLWLLHAYGYSKEECGMFLNVTKERVRQIEAKALLKMKFPGRRDELYDFFDYPTEREREQRHSG